MNDDEQWTMNDEQWTVTVEQYATTNEWRTTNDGQKREEVAFSVQAMSSLHGGQVVSEENETGRKRFTGERTLPFKGPDVTCR
jgi:hypothetical protein